MTARLSLMAFSALICVMSMSVHAWAEKRVALVIGNSAYRQISSLANPKNDAALMAQTLDNLGFTVVLTGDADRVTMARAIRKFGKKLRTAGEDSVGLLYYAGHGVQAGGANFLIPIGALIEDEADLRLEAVSVSDILAQMQSAGNRLNMVILDACRNNPFKGKIRSNVRGLARVEAASGSMVAFAAAPGQVASDGTGTNSPYTSALVSAMKRPGLTVEQVFKLARVEVETQTGGSQTPWEESSLRGEFYFNEKPDLQTPVSRDHTVELTYWNTIKDGNDPVLLKTYLTRYPHGLFAGLAEAMIKRLAATNAGDTQRRQEKALATDRAADVAYWEAISETTNPDLLRSYLERFPEGIFSQIARTRIERLEAQGAPGEDDDPFKKQQMAMLDQAAPTAMPAAPAAAKPVAPSNPQPSKQVTRIASVDAESEPDPDWAFKIQTALSRAGCDPGPVDGQWGRNSKAALDRFAKHADVTLPDEPLSDATLKLFAGRDGRVCPLVCRRRQVEKNGRCVAKTCPKGQVLLASGACQKKPRQVRRTAPQTTATPKSDPPRRKGRPKWGFGCTIDSQC